MGYKNNDRVLQKISDTEPIFVLRAQDFSAPEVVLDWISRNPTISPERRREAFECSEAMRRWPKRKTAD